MTDKLAAIQIRGRIGAKKNVKETLDLLNLQKKNALVILDDTEENKGMLKKCKDYLTYGEVDEETIEALQDEREESNNHYNLHPPRGGFRQGGIKKHYNDNGALGYRGEAINDLIHKMI